MCLALVAANSSFWRKITVIILPQIVLVWENHQETRQYIMSLMTNNDILKDNRGYPSASAYATPTLGF